MSGGERARKTDDGTYPDVGEERGKVEARATAANVYNNSVREIQRAAWQNSEDHGFHTTPINIPERLALIHSEVSEALEAYRDGDILSHLAPDGKPLGFATEIADVVIRCLDLAGSLGIDLETEILKKHAFNITRPHKHGGKRC